MTTFVDRGKTVDSILQNMWAETTLDVITKTASQQGARFYRNNHNMRDDLESWLTVEAQKLANKYQPKLNHKEPERTWGAYLWKALNECSKWHWASTIGATNDDNKQAHSRITSIDKHLGENTTQTIHTHTHMAPLYANTTTNPEDHYTHIEHLEELLNNLEHTTIEYNNHCIEDACTTPQYGNQKRCRNHHIKYRSNFEEGARCKTPHCPDRAVSLGWCMPHYLYEYNRAHRLGTTWNGRIKHTGCTVIDCPQPHHAHGLCSKHAAQKRRGKLHEQTLS